jgi:hypothetical protein
MRTYLVLLVLAGGCGTTPPCSQLDPQDCPTDGKCHLSDFSATAGETGGHEQCDDAMTGAVSSGPACDTLDMQSCYQRTDCTTVLLLKNCMPPAPPNCVPDGVWTPTSCR